MSRTEREIELMRGEYLNRPLREFCKIYKISSTETIKLFGYKYGKRKRDDTPEKIRMDMVQKASKERELKNKNDREEKIKQIMNKYGVERKVVQKLNIDYTLTEIYDAGYIENGKLKCKDTCIIYR